MNSIDSAHAVQRVIDEAERLHRFGWDLIPTCAPAAGSCTAPWHRTCASPGKVPLLRFAAAPPPWPAVAEELRRRPCGVAVLTGRQVVAVEADDPTADLLLSEIVGAVPTPCRAARPGRGRAYLFAAPSVPLGNRAHVDGHALDVRGERGILVLPPSLHPSGWVHRWAIGPESALAPMPRALLELVASPPAAQTAPAVLEVKDERPPGRLPFLLATRPLLRRLWQGTKRGGDTSRSGVDFAVARELLAAGMSPGEVAGALATRPGAHRRDPEYLRRTLVAATRRQPCR